jgi:hypothetical protein
MMRATLLAAVLAALPIPGLRHASTGKLPTISTFTASSPVQAGNASTLTITVAGATSCSVDQGVGSVSCSGTASVSPTTTTTYTLTATNAKGPVTATATVTVTGPFLFADDAGTVCHLWFDGSTWHDTKSCAWSVIGTATNVAASGLLPPGVTGFASGYSLHLATSDNTIHALTNSNFTVYVAYNYPSRPSLWYLLDATDSAAHGGFAIFGSATSDRLVFYDASGLISQTAPSAANGITVGCYGRSGTTEYTKINRGTIGSTSIARTPAVPSGVITAVGYSTSSGGAQFGGTLYELMIENTAASDSVCTSVNNTALTRMGL